MGRLAELFNVKPTAILGYPNRKGLANWARYDPVTRIKAYVNLSLGCPYPASIVELSVGGGEWEEVDSEVLVIACDRRPPAWPR